MKRNEINILTVTNDFLVVLLRLWVSVFGLWVRKLGFDDGFLSFRSSQIKLFVWEMRSLFLTRNSISSCFLTPYSEVGICNWIFFLDFIKLINKVFSVLNFMVSNLLVKSTCIQIWMLTGPWATNQLDSQTNRSIILTVWIDADFRCDYNRLQDVLHLTVGVDVAGQNLEKETKTRKYM